MNKARNTEQKRNKDGAFCLCELACKTTIILLSVKRFSALSHLKLLFFLVVVLPLSRTGGK